MISNTQVRNILNDITINEENMLNICNVIKDIIRFAPEQYNFQGFFDNLVEDIETTFDEEQSKLLEYIDFEKSNDMDTYVLNILLIPSDIDNTFKLSMDVNLKSYN